MNYGTCEECGAQEELFACDRCGQLLCEVCYGDKRQPVCFDCLTVDEAGGGRSRTGRLVEDPAPTPRRPGASRGRRRSKPRRRSRTRF